MTAPDENTRQQMAPLGIIINLLALIGLTAVTGYVTIRTFSTIGIVLFSWHPSLLTIGYLIFMSQAILVMADNNVFTHLMAYHKRVIAHWILQAIALVLITIGQSCIFINKVRLGKPHYQSIHSILGLLTFMLTILTAVGGVFSKYSYQLRTYMKPLHIKMIHSLAGIITYAMAATTISFGIFSKAWKNENDTWVLTMLEFILIVSTPYIIFGSTRLLYSRTRTSLIRPNL
ncbi:unnamed protein product [Diamesa serratosioi]